MNEKITAKHFITGIVKPKTAVKSVALGLWLFLFVAIGFTVWRAYFKKPDPTQTINVAKGATAKIIQQNAPKKTFIPFIEAGVEQRSNADMSTYIRAGLRIEF